MAELDLPLLALPIGSGRRRAVADAMYLDWWQRRSEVTAEDVARAQIQLQNDLVRLLQNPAAQLSELTEALNASLRTGLEPSQAWQVCKEIIGPWIGNDEWRDLVADAVVTWYAPYVR